MAPVVDVVVPVYNEAPTLARERAEAARLPAARFPFSWRITIVDNASTDDTWSRGNRPRARSTNVRALHLDEQGRGRALRTAWSASDAHVVAYMDVDLSTDLDALLPLVAPLVSGHSDVAIGSRLAAGSSVARRPKRELLSRGYNFMLRAVFATKIRDAQCGFKAVRAEVARALLTEVEDDGWFFDTELLLLAERNGLRIHEVAGRLDRRPRQPRARHEDRVRGSRGLGAHGAEVRGSVEAGWSSEISRAGPSPTTSAAAW